MQDQTICKVRAVINITVSNFERYTSIKASGNNHLPSQLDFLTLADKAWGFIHTPIRVHVPFCTHTCELCQDVLDCYSPGVTVPMGSVGRDQVVACCDAILNTNCTGFLRHKTRTQNSRVVYVKFICEFDPQ